MNKSTYGFHGPRQLTTLLQCLWMLVMLVFIPSTIKAEEQRREGNPHIEYLSSFGGIVSASISKGHYVYVAQRDMIRVLDISDSEHGKEAGSLRVDGIVTSMVAFAQALYVTTHAYGTTLGYSFVIDTTDPIALKITKRFSRGKNFKMEIRGKYLKFEDDQGSKSYYNISNPVSPVLEEISDTQAKELFSDRNTIKQARQANNYDQSTLYKGLSEAIDIKIDRSLAYVLDRISGLNVFNISKPEKPKFISNYKLQGNLLFVTVRNGRAFIADVDKSIVHILDISHPEKIEPMGSVNITGRIKAVDGDPRFIYVVTEEKISGLQIFDYSTKNSPYLITTFNQGSWCGEFVKKDNIGYLIVENNILSLNLKDQKSPIILGKYWPTSNPADKHTFINRICVSGNLIYSLGDHEGERCVRVLDASDPKILKLISEYSLEYYKYHAIVASKNSLYLIRGMSSNAGNYSYLDLIDYAVSSKPKYIEADEANLQSPGGIAASDDWIYVADGNGLAIFRLNK